jgi:exodeoxyribonuclease VII large subunit
MVMHHRMEQKAGADRQSLVRLQSQLRMLNPLAVLGRGYSLTRTADGRVVRTSKDVGVGEKITTRFAEGKVVSKIEEKE